MTTLNSQSDSINTTMAMGANRKYHNVMEELVTEEAKRQLASLPAKLSQYIKRVEVETYALNRLPPLYASSKEGWMQQLKRGRAEFSASVKTAVRQAIAAVQRDLLRHSTPLSAEESISEKEESNTPEPSREVVPRHSYEPMEDNVSKLDQKTVHRHRSFADNYSRKEASIRDGWFG